MLGTTGIRIARSVWNTTAAAASRSIVAVRPQQLAVQKTSLPALRATAPVSSVSLLQQRITDHAVITKRFMSASVPQTRGIEQDKPNVQIARQMPRFYSEMSNEVLLVYCAQNDPLGHRERLIREIMAVDGVEWDAASAKMNEIAAANKVGMSLATVPYKIGLTVAVLGGCASIPLCFHLDTVMWFNENFVTAEVAEPEDLETWLEVGSWAWNWMEPPLGQMSFFLLMLQFARNQMLNLGAKPYTHWLQQFRASRLAKSYPMYEVKILHDFAVSDSWT